MTLYVANGLAKARQTENSFRQLADKDRDYSDNASSVLIVCLMSTREQSELQYLALLKLISDQSGQDFNVRFAMPATHHMKQESETIRGCYEPLPKAEKNHYDWTIVTGSPVDRIAFEEVDYWSEFADFVDWQSENSKRTFFACWSAAAYAHVKGVHVAQLKRKRFGIYRFDLDETHVDRAPHSRWFAIDFHAAQKAGWRILSGDQGFGVSLAELEQGRVLLSSGHFEYDQDTLQKEYLRDIGKGMNQAKPENYLLDNQQVNDWRQPASELLLDWLGLAGNSASNGKKNLFKEVA
ncbi:homoserine O-acetyltransferase/O-succinyltransferase family protein [Oenococcus kitaharae]|uniref:Homoserine O-acetyltransferase n=1 Tax=Oenococcus kitaharae DSM 17330 TaxID=1045004 RepID=G9WGX1_9LACO|nr:homoserine O-succinyltransferase [Oenococcus kitaharae]EHN59379.1 Homoserine O-succinyltransferase [Oenococcus kitaharae DSM 17330]OEY83261.1 hypothetical protein NT95_03685 [Oenococcus kitaharae]OEY85059.1 hypothetical protein NT96_00125 [Oenococcus kitaharae]OEY85914.1 hypothetical protein NV75_00075 [Oenococcus kitaharae]